ncbi:MAG: hypothetical protein JF614_26485 [Acidobacteria bacterium]|nr:hypothetical protein [Acidobacteriota bacterium]
MRVTESESEILAATGAAPTCRPVQLCAGCPQWSGYPGSKFLTFAGTGSDQGARDYYAAVDPQSKRKTLGTWWTVNGFGSGGAGGVRASYLNNNDLGFGRDMHCIQKGQDLACYVTNYGCPDQDPKNADLAAAANPADRVATVTMEYSAVEGQDPKRRIVKFFVYKGGTIDSPLITSADLDGFGDKNVPQLCLNCHGGQYSPSGKPSIDDIDMKSSFREFDLPSFRYTSGRDFTKLTPQELDTFKALNDVVVASQPSDPIKQLIAGWYAGGGSTFNDKFVPAQWIDAANPLKQQLYLGAVAQSCRTCHVAFRGGDIDWSTYSQFQRRRSIINLYVCGSSKIMPHAAITYINFWGSRSPSLPNQLAQFKASDWTAFGTCK